jgi:serine/threonine protein kinase
VRKIYGNELDGSEFENEVRTLMKVAHKNIVRFIGYCSQTKGKLVEYNGKYVMAESRERLICMEYMPKGSLYNHMHGKLDTACPSINYISFFLHFLSTIYYLCTEIEDILARCFSSLKRLIIWYGGSSCFFLGLHLAAL